MKIHTKLIVLASAMLAIIVSGVTLSVWSVNQADLFLKRISLANQIYGANLSLSNHTYQLFKQFGDVLIVGRHGSGDQKVELLGKIDADFQSIRSLINLGEELGETDSEQMLQDLAELETEIQTLAGKLYAITKGANEDPEARLERLRDILDTQIDTQFRDRNQDILDQERAETLRTETLAHRQLNFHKNLALMFIAIAFLVVAVGFWVIKRGLRNRLIVLSAGADRLSAGELDYRIPVTGEDELGTLADTLNQLAERVDEREKALRASNEDLERKVKERTIRLEKMLGEVSKTEFDRKRLMADVSHELRTPLTIIRGEADIALRGTKSTEELRNALAAIQEAASHTSRIVNDLLLVARSESGELQLHVEETDIVPILESFLVSGTKQIDLRLDGPTAPVECDADRIRQAFLIVVENARNYGGDEIIIRLVSRDGGYRVTIEDDGAGLSDEDKQNAFYRYYRGPNAADQYSAGTGLGLPVAKSIVEAHHGTIALKDRDPSGLIVEIYLPRHYPQSRHAD